MNKLPTMLDTDSARSGLREKLRQPLTDALARIKLLEKERTIDNDEYFYRGAEEVVMLIDKIYEEFGFLPGEYLP